MQLDIFNDGRDVQLRNDLADALACDDADAARAAAAALQAAFPRDDTLPPAQALIDALDLRQAPAFASHDDLAAARGAMTASIAPAATRVLGAGASPWLALRWGEMASGAVGLPFDAVRSEDHAAPLWLRASRWAEAAAAIERIESWRRKPVPLGWMAQARYHLQGLDSTWTLLAELAWMSCERLDVVLRSLDDPLLRRLRDGFEERFNDGVPTRRPNRRCGWWWSCSGWSGRAGSARSCKSARSCER
ncbi:MAG: hypothetical protein EOO29_34180 [Comamonadaceae bacterium]|nr:MAG: hypothetical protein EOO29_34180 [Comamonadaceae bacterium]